MTERQNRTPRDADAREAGAREVSWKPAAMLPDPEQLPGYGYRWIRSAMVGVSDAMNVSARTREGWEPVDPKEQPRLKMFARDGMIEVGGLILCKMPEELIAARRKYYTNQTNRQMESVDQHYMRENDPRMPLFKERRSEVTFGNGS